jgi:hypothetical protein
VSRIRWFLAGAAVTAGALAAAPGAYQRLRSVIGPVTSPLLPSGLDDEDEFEASGDLSAFDAAVDEPAPFVPGPAAAADPVGDDTAELRMRIDNARARIHERAQSARGDEEPPSEAGEESAPPDL